MLKPKPSRGAETATYLLNSLLLLLLLLVCRPLKQWFSGRKSGERSQAATASSASVALEITAVMQLVESIKRCFDVHVPPCDFFFLSYQEIAFFVHPTGPTL